MLLDNPISCDNTRTFVEKPTIGLLRNALYFPSFLASLCHAYPTMFLWFQAFSLKVESSISTVGFGHQTVQQTSSGNS
jgi:hypothetical protein